MQASPVANAATLVVKVGSSLVTNGGRGLDSQAIARWAAQIAQLRALGKRCLMVSSGAIAEGLQRLGWAKRPSAIHELQAHTRSLPHGFEHYRRIPAHRPTHAWRIHHDEPSRRHACRHAALLG